MEWQLSLVGERPTAAVLERFGAVGLLRGEFLQRATLRSITAAAVQRSMGEYLEWVATAMRPRHLWYRTADLWSDEGNVLRGATTVEWEKNPVLGLRGIRRSLVLRDEFALECAVLAAVQERHATVRVQFPFVSTAEEFATAVERAEGEGVVGPFATMVETPAAALAVDELLDAGACRLLVGLNDLSCLVSASERASSPAAKLGRPLWDLVGAVAAAGRRRGVPVGLAGAMDRSIVERARQTELDFVTLHYSGARALLGGDAAAWPDEGMELAIKTRTRDAIAQAQGDRHR